MAPRDATSLIAVHRELRKRGTTTRPVLERFFGSSRQSMSLRINRLERIGSIEKVPQLRRGNTDVWRARPNLAFALAVSVKRDRIAARLLDLEYLTVGSLAEEEVNLVDLVDADEIVEKIATVAARALDSARAEERSREDPLSSQETLDVADRTLGVTVSLPTPVYRVRTRGNGETAWTMRTASRWIMPNLAKADFDLHTALRRQLSEKGLPAEPLALINDASAAALGTVVDLRMQGMPRPPRDLALLWLAEGVGGGVISGHRLVTGNAGFAAEIGHLAVRADGVLCRHCGARGCLETVASTGAINREVNAAFVEGATFGWSGEHPLVVDVGEDVLRHPAYTEAMREAGWWTGIALAQVVNLFNPQIVVLTDPHGPSVSVAEIGAPAPVRDKQFQRSVEGALRRNSLDPSYHHLMGAFGNQEVYGLQFGVHSRSDHGIDVSEERAPMLEMVGAAADLVDTFADEALAARLKAAHQLTPMD